MIKPVDAYQQQFHRFVFSIAKEFFDDANLKNNLRDDGFLPKTNARLKRFVWQQGDDLLMEIYTTVAENMRDCFSNTELEPELVHEILNDLKHGLKTDMSKVQVAYVFENQTHHIPHDQWPHDYQNAFGDGAYPDQYHLTKALQDAYIPQDQWQAFMTDYAQRLSRKFRVAERALSVSYGMDLSVSQEQVQVDVSSTPTPLSNTQVFKRKP